MKEKIRYCRGLALLAFLSVLALSLLLYCLTEEKKEPVPLILTVRMQGVDSLVASLTEAGALPQASLEGERCACELLDVTPTELWDSDAGLRYPSSLYRDITLRVRLDGCIREGVYYASETLLSVGKELTLLSPALEGKVTVLGIEQGQVG